MIIYKATNKINGNCYIGKTIQHLRERKSAHELHASKNSNFYFHRALRKYGFNNFGWKILFHAIDENELDQMEKYFIANYKATNYLYNMTAGGRGLIDPVGETRRKLSTAGKGKKNPFYGKHHSEETKIKLSLSRMGKVPWNKGLPRDEATCHKISKANKGRLVGDKNPMFGVPSPNKNKHISEWQKKRISESKKLYWEMRRKNVL
jgi:group I intron endonuclease